MSRTYMIDTNTVTYIVKGNSSFARASLAGLHGNEISCISAITEAEIRYGLAKTPNATVRSAIEGFLAKIQILPWGTAEAIAYGDLRGKMERSGKVLGNLDLLIAAHAIATDSILVTSDKSFRQVGDLPGLVNWARDL